MKTFLLLYLEKINIHEKLTQYATIKYKTFWGTCTSFAKNYKFCPSAEYLNKMYFTVGQN